MSAIIEEKNATLPVLALRGLVVFPGTVLSFDVGRKKSAAALKYAMERNQLVFAVAQKDLYVESPENDDLYEMGCVIKIRQIIGIHLIRLFGVAGHEQPDHDDDQQRKSDKQPQVPQGFPEIVVVGFQTYQLLLLGIKRYAS